MQENPLNAYVDSLKQTLPFVQDSWNWGRDILQQFYIITFIFLSVAEEAVKAIFTQ